MPKKTAKRATKKKVAKKAPAKKTAAKKAAPAKKAAAKKTAAKKTAAKKVTAKKTGDEKIAAQKPPPKPPTKPVIKPPAPETLAQRVETLLAAKIGVNESRAKKLRKQWKILRKASPDAKFTDLENLFERLRERVHKQVELRERQYAAVEGGIKTLREEIAAGKLKSAQTMEKKMVADLKKIYGLSAARKEKITEQLAQLKAEIKNMTSWRKWGTRQAREQIIQEIREIHKHEDDLEKIAKRIQKARDQWREWDLSGERGDPKLYKEFDETCTQAYQACEAFFTRQKKLRAQGTKQREQLCEELENRRARMDWRKVDWKEVQRFVRASRIKWRTLPQPDYKIRKALTRRFESVAEKYEQTFERERMRCMKQRRELIIKISQLAQMENLHAAIRQVKELQKQYLVTIASSREQEKSVWEDFNAACEKVYARRKQQRAEEETAREENLKTKQAICTRIQLYCEQQDDADADAQAIAQEIAKWQREWKAAGAVPSKDAEAISKRHKILMRMLEDKHTRVAARQRQDREQALLQQSLACARLEHLALEGGGGEPMQPALDALTESARKKMQKRIDLANRAQSDEARRRKLTESVDANRQQLHALLLQWEIALSIDSPAEFTQDRMAMQVNRLSAAIGKGARTELLPPEKLFSAILCVGAVPREVHANAMRRFYRCVDAMTAAASKPKNPR